MLLNPKHIRVINFGDKSKHSLGHIDIMQAFMKLLMSISILCKLSAHSYVLILTLKVLNF